MWIIWYTVQTIVEMFSEGFLKRFRDLVIQDSTIIRLHESLAKTWPAARTKKIAAGVKVSDVNVLTQNTPADS